MVPYPAQGHVTPMLKLASGLASRGFEPVLVTPEFIHRSIAPQIGGRSEISCTKIPDELDEGIRRDFFAIEMAMENNMPVHLERIVQKLVDEDGGRVACFVVDLLASWAIKVGCDRGIPVAGFWPGMLEAYHLITAIPDMIQTGIISETGIPQYQGPVFFKSLKPMLSTEDLPWLIGTSVERKSRFKFWTKTLDRSKALQWLLVNSYPDHDEDDDDDEIKTQQMIMQVTNYDSQGDSPHILPVGPLSNDYARMKNASFWEEDVSCLDWLGKHKDGCVVYISFGSWVSPIEEGKVKSLALALEASMRPFIWVLGCNWRQGLPSGYMERVWKRGKIVSWAPQMEVLQHKAVGCYLTHCGWNSTMEAIQCRKRMLCYPVAGDQFLNCAYIVKVWRIGVKLSVFGQRDLEDGIERVMEDDEMSNRLMRLNERVMGKEANSRMMDNLATFTDFVSQQNLNS